ncbi:hypothetical protein SCHPADRAFT_886401 [Schizopora paradoxa]|uniref:Uncharacterized protein n=1 Tax=Schizopora paradoxa TaxID=27342 RepID=A0A0H2S2N6_9AGAM|nr:hypothetical protein SCHPADRAFT_886401 [Schizopora paradoxa]
MARSSKDTANLLHCHRSIESYCAEKTDELLEYMTNLFSDIDSIVRNALLRDDNDTLGLSLESDSDVEGLRRTTDECRLLTHLHRMQLEVLSRANRRKEQDLNVLIENSASLSTTINANILATRSLPTLPNEVLSQIFSLLYRMEDTRETTLNRLIEDGGTPVNWRLAIRRCIPNAIAAAGAFGGVHDRENHILVGPHPSLHHMSRIDEDSLGLLKSKSTFIFATLLDMQEMEKMQHIPWHNLVLSTKTISTASQEAVLRTFVRNFGAKLAEVDRLDIRSPHKETVGSFNDASNASTQEIAENQFLQSKLRKVRLQLGMLPILRPFLCNIVDLDIVVSSRQSIPTAKTLLRGLAPYSNTLTRLKYGNPAGLNEELRSHSRLMRSSDAFNEATLRFSFPHLKQLMVFFFPECYARDILQRMDSPSLHHLSLSFQGCECPDNVAFESISASMLHKAFPVLEAISVGFKQRSRDFKFYMDLATPNEGMGWILPMLDAISIVINYRGERGTKALRSTLLALTKVVRNRLSAIPCATSLIHSIHILRGLSEPEMDPEILSTFKLLVPHLVLQKFDSTMF